MYWQSRGLRKSGGYWSDLPKTFLEGNLKSYNVTGVLGVVAGVRWLLVWSRVYSGDSIRYLDEGKKKESDGYWSGSKFILKIQ